MSSTAYEEAKHKLMDSHGLSEEGAGNAIVQGLRKVAALFPPDVLPDDFDPKQLDEMDEQFLLEFARRARGLMEKIRKQNVHKADGFVRAPRRRNQTPLSGPKLQFTPPGVGLKNPYGGR